MSSLATQHYQRVRTMMQGFGQETPSSYKDLDEKTRELRARLILEEALELIQNGLGVTVCQTGEYLDFDAMSFKAEGKYNAIEMADGCADLSVVNIGTLVAAGIPDAPLLEEVDANNLLKVKRGHKDEKTGKFIKPKDHPAPSIESIIQLSQVTDLDRGYALCVSFMYSDIPLLTGDRPDCIKVERSGLTAMYYPQVQVLETGRYPINEDGCPEPIQITPLCGTECECVDDGHGFKEPPELPHDEEG